MEQRRYKKRGLQFNSTSDSRALRAINYQERRKSRRNDILTHRRQMDCLEDSMDKGRLYQSISTLSDDENKLRKTQKELRLERYKQLLKWKEQKKKQLDKEKRKRKPSFKTGVFQPDPPRYLVSGDMSDMGKSVNQTPGKATPFKFLLSSSKKFGRTPGTSMQKIPVFHTGVTPATSTQRMLQFHTGVTPKETLRRDRILRGNMCGKKRTEKSEIKENYVAPRTRAMLKRIAKSEHVSKASQRCDFLQEKAAGFNFHFVADAQTLRHSSRFLKSTLDFDSSNQTSSSAVSECSKMTCDPESEVTLETEEKSITEKDILECNDAIMTEVDCKVTENETSKKEDKEHKECIIEEQVENKFIIEEQSGKKCIIEEQSGNECIIEEQLGKECIIEEQSGKECIIEEQSGKECIIEEQSGKECIIEEQSGKECIIEEQLGKECIIEEQSEKESTENELNISCADIQYLDQDDMNTSGNTKTGEEGVMVDEDKERALESIAEDDCANSDLNVNSEDHCTAQYSNEQADESKRRVSVATPAKCRTRKSTSCCDVTPTISRLRPRTPCSRKTRRSLSAHCDPPSERITRSGKKALRRSSRCSVNDAVKLNNKVSSEKHVNKFSLFEIEDANNGNTEPENESSKNWKQVLGVKEDDQKQLRTPFGAQKLKETKSEMTSTTVDLSNSSVLLTPNSSGHRTKVSWKIDISPWIDKSRRSSKKRGNYGTPDFQKIPDDIFIEGSPYLAQMLESVGSSKHDDPPVVNVENRNSPEIDDSKVAENQTCKKLLPLLEPSSPSSHTTSPDIDVWSEVSPAVPSSVNDPTTEIPVKSRNIIPKILTTLLPASDKETGFTPSAQTSIKVPTPTIPASNHIMLAAPSVVDDSQECKENEEPFDPNQQPNSVLPDKSVTRKRKSRRSVMFSLKEEENDACPTFRFPGTPIRASSRVSMGLFSKVDMNTDSIFPWDKDLIDLDSPKSERKTTATRKSSRVSLLPGMKSSPVPMQKSPVTQDLIRWDTPIEPKKRNSRSAVSSLATPIRRSKRLSKAQAL